MGAGRSSVVNLQPSVASQSPSALKGGTHLCLRGFGKHSDPEPDTILNTEPEALVAKSFGPWGSFRGKLENWGRLSSTSWPHEGAAALSS